MPILGKDKESEKIYKQHLQKRYQILKARLDEIRAEILKEKDYPLNQRKGVIFDAPIDFLITYPGLERQHSKEYIESLKISIDESGILHKPICTLGFDGINAFIPLADKKASQDEQITGLEIYIVCGNARVQACKELGFSTIPVIIKYLTPDEAFQLSLTENEEREELNPIDRALLFKNWIERTGISQSEIARRRNKTQPWVSLHLKLLTLPKKVQELIRERKVSLNQMNKILQISDPDIQTQLAELCAEGLSEKELDLKIQQAKLKLIPINAFIPPAPQKPYIKPDVIPPRPISPPKPLPPEKPKSEAERITSYIKKAIEESIKSIEGKEDNFGMLFPAVICGFKLIIETCNADCNHCKRVYACQSFLKILQEKFGYNFPGLAGYL